MNAKQQKKKCLAAGCERPQKSRGLCSGHYQIFVDEFKSLETEEQQRQFVEKAIAAGVLLPKEKSGPKAKLSNPFERIANEVRRDGPSPHKSRSPKNLPS